MHSPKGRYGSVATALLFAASACSPRSGERADSGQIDTAASKATIGAAAGAPTTPAKPNEQMQAVLDQLAALHPKPITELSAPEARKQPSPADAVKALLKKQGKSTAPEPVGSVVNRTIPGAGGPIPIRIYTPEGNGPFPGGGLLSRRWLGDRGPGHLRRISPGDRQPRQRGGGLLALSAGTGTQVPGRPSGRIRGVSLGA